MDDNQQPKGENLTMQEMFMKYPIGSQTEGKEVKGYRKMKDESALMLGDGSWKK